MNEKADEIKRIYNRAVEYFTNQTEGFVVESPLMGRYFSLRKRGSDLCFKLNIGDYENIYLEVMQIESTMNKGNSFTKSVVGVVEYKYTGECDNIGEKKVKLPNKRQQLELQEMIDHVQRSIRPNSINFILDD